VQLTEEAQTDTDSWQTISTELHFEDAHVAIVTEQVQTPARVRSQSWTTVRRKRAVIIAPMTADGQLVLIRQERIPIRTVLWELPAGQIDAVGDIDGDEIAAVALRELREEAGYQLAAGGELLPLGDFFSSPGFTDERGFFFLARPVELSPHGKAHQESESILDCRGFSPAELSVMISANEIRDASTLSICAKLIAHGLLTLGSSR
jgi:8-oxo-dGTP pyrophosphatase MutT (NUDIX family)